MLVISRKEGERICIGEDIHVVLLKAKRGRVTIGIEAPDDVRIMRSEVGLENDFFELPIESSNIEDGQLVAKCA